MAADIVEAAQYTRPVADDEDRPAGDLRRQVASRVRQLVDAAHHLPFAGKDGTAFLLPDALIAVPSGREGGGAVELGRIRHRVLLPADYPIFARARQRDCRRGGIERA